jgi:hypothetical protein
MAQHTPHVGNAPTESMHEPPMAGTGMAPMNSIGGHVDSAAGAPGYKPETHARYRPQQGRADKHASNVIQDAYLAGKI